MRLTVTPVVLAAWVVGPCAERASACTCAPACAQATLRTEAEPCPPDALIHLENSDVVFLGAVLSVEVPDSPTQGCSTRATMSVERVWKGELADRATVATSCLVPACGYPFEKERRYLVFAGESDGGLGTTQCSGTMEARYAEEAINLLDEALGSEEEAER